MRKLSFTLILQARLKSLRYPQKVLKKLKDDEIVVFLQKRLLTLGDFIDNFILAVPESEKNIFEKYLVKGFHLEFGSEENVLDRFAKAFSKYEADYLIRATSDNPFTSLEILKENIVLLNNLNENNEKLWDYLVRENLPIGSQTEIVKKEAFWLNYRNAREKYHFEHVTPYIYENDKLFYIRKIPCDKYNLISNLRLTIDTEQDYIVANNIVEKYRDINNNKPYFLIDLDDILKIYEKYKELLELNKNIVQKGYKE